MLCLTHHQTTRSALAESLLLIPLESMTLALKHTCFTFICGCPVYVKMLFVCCPSSGSHPAASSLLLSPHPPIPKKSPTRSHCPLCPPLWLRPVRLCFSPGSWGCDGWPEWCTAAVWNTPWTRPWSTQRRCHPVGEDFRVTHWLAKIVNTRQWGWMSGYFYMAVRLITLCDMREAL